METIVMSGGTRGIGREAVRRMALCDSSVTLVLLARAGADLSWTKGELGGRPGLHVVECDMGSVRATRAAAARIVELVADRVVPPLGAVVLNAGVQHVDACQASADGLEDTFAVNVVANHVLVRGLAPHLRVGGRVIVTVSDTHFGDLRHNLGMVPGPRWRDTRLLARPGTAPRARSTAAGRTAYSTSKLAAIYQVHEYARQYPEAVVVGYNPGFVPGTGLARDAGLMSRLAMARLLPLLSRTPLASTVETAGRDLAALASGRVPVPTGAYVNRDRTEASSLESYDVGRETALVAFLDSVVAKLSEGR